MIKQLFIPLCVLILGVESSSAAPDWKKDLGPTKPGKHAPLPPGKLEYTLSWKGLLNSGKLGFEIGKVGAHKPGVIVIQSTGKSMGPGGVVFPYNGHSWSEINVDTLRPRLLTSTETKRGKEIKTRNVFFSNRVTHREISQSKKEHDIQTHIFSQSPVYDIGSAILFIRSQPLKKGDEIKLMMHPYGSPYLLNAKVLGREKLNGKAAIKLSLTLKKIDPKTFELRPYKKMKEPAQLWFSDDKLRLPMEVRSKVFIGDVRATLKGFKKS